MKASLGAADKGGREKKRITFDNELVLRSESLLCGLGIDPILPKEC